MSTCEIPFGLCQCGCGQPTSISDSNCAKRGLVKGQPKRFITGHNGLLNRKLGAPYRATRFGKGKREKLHRLRAERALGKPLPVGAMVHHADGSTQEDAPLVICQDIAYHNLLHYRMRVKAAGGNPNTDTICGKCRQVLPLTQFVKQRIGGWAWTPFVDGVGPKLTFGERLRR